MSGEFAIVRVFDYSGGETIELARTSAAGQLLGGARVEQYATAAIAEIDVNAHSGHYLVVWDDGGVLGAEHTGSGRVISQGMIVAAKLEDYLMRHPEIERTLEKKGRRIFLTTESSERTKHLANLFYESAIRLESIPMPVPGGR